MISPTARRWRLLRLLVRICNLATRTARTNRTEHAWMQAKTAGMRSSSWIRAAAKSAKVVPRLTDDERRILWMLAELANNLNQLTKRAHQLGLLRVVRDCSEIMKEIDITLKNLNNNDRQSDNG